MVSCCALYLSCLIIYRWLTTSLKVDEDIAVTFPNELYSPTYMRYERAKQEKISTSFDCGPNFSENFYFATDIALMKNRLTIIDERFRRRAVD